MTASTIRVESDTATLLQALSKTFTRSTTVIGEMLQNARRAGATRVNLTLTDTDLTVEDDGCGIADFSVLLSIAKSGWDKAIQQSDAPYGIGLVSVLFACEDVEIISKGQRAQAKTSDLIAIRPVALTAVPDTGTTTLRLGGHRLGKNDAIANEIRRLVAGFPIPVFLNGEEVPRPHAVGAMDFIETPVGLATPGVRICNPVRHVYLQGLPISVPRCTSGYCNTEIVHLSSPMFEGRMPERDSLLEPERSAEKITAALEDVARQYLVGIAPTMTDEEFVGKYGVLAGKLDLRDLLNAKNCIPAQWVCRYDTPFKDTADGPGYTEAPKTDVVTRAELEAKGLFVVAHESEETNWETDLLAAHAVAGLDAFVTHNGLPSWHWGSALSQEVGPEDFELVPGTTVGEDNLEIYYENVTLRLVESIGIRRRGESHVDAPLIPADCYFNVSEGVLYVTGEAGPFLAVSQVSDFECEERYEESECDQAQDRFLATVKVLQNNDPADLLHAFLDKGLPYTIPTSLRSKSFLVTMDENGKAVVTNA